MTDVEEETIKSEVKRDFNVMLELVQKLDLETAFKYYWDSPDFMGIGPDGMIMDFAQFKKANEDMANAAKSMQFTNYQSRETVASLIPTLSGGLLSVRFASSTKSLTRS